MDSLWLAHDAVVDWLANGWLGWSWWPMLLFTLATTHVTIAAGDGATLTAEATGDGPVDALMKAIDAAIGTSGTLLEYTVAAVTSGKDALGEARVVCEIDGRTYTGLGVSTDVLEASAIAYIRAVNASRKVEESDRVTEGV